MRKMIAFFGMMGILLAAGCTSNSTRLAQSASMRVQAAHDGVHDTMMKALARENYESAVLRLKLEVAKAKDGQPEEVREALDGVQANAIAGIKEFATKRDTMTTWDRDHERANAFKYVTVDTKLYSSQGILNYFGNLFTGETQKAMETWDQNVEHMQEQAKEEPSPRPDHQE